MLDPIQTTYETGYVLERRSVDKAARARKDRDPRRGSGSKPPRSPHEDDERPDEDRADGAHTDTYA